MKKFIAILVCVTMFSACVKKPTDTTTPTGEPTQPTQSAQASPSEPPQSATSKSLLDEEILAWFPFEANTAYSYVGNGVFAESTNDVYNGYVNANRIQRRIHSDQTSRTEVLDLTDGELNLIFGEPSYYFYDNITTSNPTFNYTILKAPLTLGQTWQADETTTSEITSVDEKITTDAGEFTTLVVTSKPDNGNIEKYYYAKGIGLVKSEQTSSMGDISSTLKEYKKDTAISIPVEFKIPNLTQNTIETEERNFILKTNDDFTAQIEKEMKIVKSDDYAPLLTPNTKINSISFDWKNYMLTIDLSKDYYTESNYGDSIQETILQATADTLGDFYGVKKVIITVDGAPLRLGTISKNEGDFYEVESQKTIAPVVN